MKISLATYKQFLMNYLKPQLGSVLLMAVLLLSSIALRLVGPQMVGQFIDTAEAKVSEQSLVVLALLFMLITIMQQVVNGLATYCSERVAWTATNALRIDIVDHLLRLDLSFHKKRTPGELIERVDGDVNALAEFFSSFVLQIGGNVILLAGILAAFYMVDVRIGLAFTTFSGLALLLLLWVRRFGARHWREERECSAQYYGYISELLTAIEDVRASGAVPYALRRFVEQRRAWLPVALRADLWGGLIWMTAVALFAIADATAYGFSGGLYTVSAISLGQVYLIIAYTAMLIAPIEAIRTQLKNLQRADAGIARVQELLANTSKLRDGLAVLPSGPLSVEFRDVSFWYEDEDFSHEQTTRRRTSAITHLSFSLKPGCILGLLGRTGSGKTTVARLLFRMYDPQQGAVCLGDVDLRHARKDAVRQAVGLVTQDVQIFEASLRDNISFFDHHIPDDHILEVFEALGLSQWLARLPQGLNSWITGATLSAGEAQLVALARIFLKDPRLIILDEVSSHLDPATEMLLERALDKLLEGRTAIIITHRLTTIRRADDILIVDQGAALEYGPRQQLSNCPSSHFVQLQKAGFREVLT